MDDSTPAKSRQLVENLETGIITTLPLTGIHEEKWPSTVLDEKSIIYESA
jgi:hypothetical protein